MTAAADLNISRSTYLRMEHDEIPYTGAVSSITITAAERCIIYRRRANKTQGEVAEDMKYCRNWVNGMENGKRPCDDLLWYWEQ